MDRRAIPGQLEDSLQTAAPFLFLFNGNLLEDILIPLAIIG